MLLPMRLSSQLLKYFCSNCGTLLKETKETSNINLKICNLEEECPNCGSLLAKTLKKEWELNVELQSQQLNRVQHGSVIIIATKISNRL